MGVREVVGERVEVRVTDRTLRVLLRHASSHRQRERVTVRQRAQIGEACDKYPVLFDYFIILLTCEDKIMFITLRSLESCQAGLQGHGEHALRRQLV